MSETEKKRGIITIPNLLSLFRVCLIPVMVYLYLTGKSNYAVGGVLLLSGITDILDGFIARRFNLETNLGRILDPVADKMTHIIICAVLMRAFPLLTWMLVIFCVKEACLSILGWRYMRMTGIVNSARWYGKVGSIVQYAVMLSLIVLPHLSETTITLLIAICMGTHIVALFLYARFYLYSKSPKHQNMQPADWQSFVMALLFVGSIFVLVFSKQESFLRNHVWKPLYLFIQFACIVGLTGIPAFFWGEKIPRDKLSADKFPFKTWKWEDDGKFYDKIGIRYWKNLTPDMSKHMTRAFAKQGNLLRDPNHLKKLVAETLSAELVHWILMLNAIVFYCLMDSFALGAAILYIIGNLISLVIQRYNRPRILKLIERMEKRKCANS